MLVSTARAWIETTHGEVPLLLPVGYFCYQGDKGETIYTTDHYSGSNLPIKEPIKGVTRRIGKSFGGTMLSFKIFLSE